jgi:hypothetical protein
MAMQSKRARHNMKQTIGCMCVPEFLSQINTSRFNITKNKRPRTSVT